MDIIVEISAFCRNIVVPWILSTFRGSNVVTWILSTFCGYIGISWILSTFCGNIHVLCILSAFRLFYLSNFIYLVKVTGALFFRSTILKFMVTGCYIPFRGVLNLSLWIPRLDMSYVDNL